jgi:hypothetical protein
LLYAIRGLLRHGAEHLSPRQITRLDAGLAAGDPGWELTVAWHCYQQLRSIYHARSPAEGRRLTERVIALFPTCPIGEVARLGRTLRAWRAQVLAYFDTGGVSNGGTEAINLLIEKTRRLAHGFRTFTHYRLRILLAADGTRPSGLRHCLWTRYATRRMARVGCRLTRREAAAMLAAPASRCTLIARLRSVAMTAEPVPVRTWDRSSAKVTSRTQ